jgi:hypothetical protein
MSDGTARGDARAKAHRYFHPAPPMMVVLGHFLAQFDAWSGTVFA